MTVKVSDVMRHVRNHFILSTVTGNWNHVGGTLTPADAFAPGMWIAITGVENGAPCGVFQLDDQGGIPGLGDTQWSGRIYRLNPPADFIRLCGDINCWATAHPDPSATGEKLGQYSLSRRGIGWEAAFAPALAPYQRMYAEVQV